MLNKVELMGRFTADPELKMINGATPVVNFSLAVPRTVKKEDGERISDFIECSAWRHTAEFIARSFRKGQQAVVVGSIRTKKWLSTENETRYRTEVLVNEIYFTAAAKPDAPPGAPDAPEMPSAPYEPLYELAADEELPF